MIFKVLMSNGNEIWARRLKEARTISNLSQKQLGIQAGLDEFVASTRINRYELGVHKADYQTAQRLAAVLKIPTSYFYTEDDSLAQLILLYFRANVRRKAELLKIAKEL
jgi:transcriptional regulator with XRE-family HTH domain